MRDKNSDIKSNSDPTINIAVSCYLSNSCYSILLDLIIIILLIGSMLHTPTLGPHCVVAGEGRRVVGNIIINTLVTGVVPQEMGIPNSALNHQIPETP